MTRAPARIPIEEEIVQSVFELIMSWRRDGDGRRGAIALPVAVLLFVAALALTTTSTAYGAKKPKVKASIHKGRLNVLGTPGNDRITLRLKPGDKSRLQVDVGGDGSAEFTFKRSRFARIAVHAGGGSDALAVDERYGVFVNTEATFLFGDGGTDLVTARGSNGADRIAVSRDQSSLRYARNGSAFRAAVERLNVDARAGSDQVTVQGSAGNDTLGVAPAALARHIAVSGAATALDVVNAEELAVEGLAGNDALNGAVGLAPLTKLTLDGGAGNDMVGGGDGADVLRGGTDNDSIDGNRGDDAGLLGAGDDSFIWDPGDGSDKVEGEGGADTLVFNGAGIAENFDFSASGSRLKLFRNAGNITMDVDDTERVDLRALGGVDNTVVNDLAQTDVKSIDLDLATDGAVDTTTVNGSGGNDAISIAPNAGAVDVTGLAAALKIRGSEPGNDVLNVNGLGGDDTIDGAVGLAALITIGTIDGGDGNDTINGGDGAENLVGANGNDAVDGNRGNDIGVLGAGDDSFRWDPGDGSDTVEGHAGADTLVFNGAGVIENFDVSANGGRVRFFRDAANITMDLDDVETIVVEALGGADKTVVNDLTGTDVKAVDVDLEGAIGGGAGDASPDVVTVNGTGVDDAVNIAPAAGGIAVGGLAAVTRVLHAEGDSDTLTVNGLRSEDTLSAATLPAAAIQLQLDGGAGNDSIFGGQGADVLFGDADDDAIDGNQGSDVGVLGAGDDKFIWDPGDGSDDIEGDAGSDTLVFNGSNGAENFDLSANGQRLRLFRNLGNITMFTSETESVDLRALGGADNTVVNDLTGTDITKASIDLAGSIGGDAGDAGADTVTVKGTDGNDDVAVEAAGSGVNVGGLSAGITIGHPEVANDLLAISTLGGDDDVAIGAGVNALIQTLVDLGTGE
jgi:Ca2+-binding RTX toxin-like protein